jgi:hypothetical protein
MKTLKTLDQIIKLAQTHSGETLFVRWSRGPALDQKRGYSIDHSSGSRHNGLSADYVRADDPELLARMLTQYQTTRMKDSKIYCWIFAGIENGRDSDNAPTVAAETIVPLGKVDETLIRKCSAYNQVYWEHRRRYAWNAWKPEHHALNADLTARLTAAWNAIR